MPAPPSVTKALKHANRVDARAEAARRAALRQQQQLQEEEQQKRRAHEQQSQTPRPHLQPADLHQEPAVAYSLHSSANTAEVDSVGTAARKEIEQRSAERLRQRQHDVQGLQDRMDRLSQVMAALIGSSSAEATAPALSPPSKTEDRARTAPTVSRDEASSAHQAEVSQQVVAQLRKERQQLREQLQQAAHLMADVRQRLTRDSTAKGAWASSRQRTAVLRVLLSELRQLFEDNGIVAVAEAGAKEEPASGTRRQSQPQWSRRRSFPHRATAVAHTQAFTGQATRPRSATSQSLLQHVDSRSSAGQRGLESVVQGLFQDAERSLTALEMDLDAVEAGAPHDDAELEPMASMVAATLEENRSLRTATQASLEMSARHAALHEQIRHLRTQVESLVSAREQEKEERANLLREKEELQHLVDALRSQLASLREQRAEELAQTALDVSRASSASTEWRQAAEASLREADALRQHTHTLSADLTSARQQIAALERRHQADVAREEQLNSRIQELEDMSMQLSHDLDAASAQMSLAGDTRVDRSRRFLPAVVNADDGRAADNKSVGHQRIGADDEMLDTGINSQRGDKHQGHSFLAGPLSSTPARRPPPPRTAVSEPARDRGRQWQETSASASFSELGQLDRDIQALKRSLHALLQ